MKKYLTETILGLLLSAGILFAAYMAVKLVNDDVDSMIKKTRTPEIVATR